MEKLKADLNNGITQIKIKYESEIGMLESKIAAIEARMNKEIETLVEKNKREILEALNFVNGFGGKVTQRETLPKKKSAAKKSSAHHR